jgi:hypothetical protein
VPYIHILFSPSHCHEPPRVSNYLISLFDLINHSSTLVELTIIFLDSQQAIEYVKSEGITARNKHFDIVLFKTRTPQRAKIVSIVFKGTDENAADGLTQALVEVHHKTFLGQLTISTIGEGLMV